MPSHRLRLGDGPTRGNAVFRPHTRREGPLPFVKRRPTTNPILPVVDMAEAVAFYEQLGFEVVSYDEGYAWVNHCGWEWLHLRAVESVEGNAASAYLHVDDSDAWRAAMVASSGGVIELGETGDMPWGKREFSFIDPAGNLIRLGSGL